MEPPAPTPAPGEVELWVVAVELVLGTDAPPDVPLDVVVPGAVVAGVEVVVAAVDADVEDVVIGRERFAGGGAGEDELEVAASEPPPHAPIDATAATASMPPPARTAARLTTPR